MSQLLTNIKTFVNKYFYKREEKPVKYKEWFSIIYSNGDLYINEEIIDMNWTIIYAENDRVIIEANRNIPTEQINEIEYNPTLDDDEIYIDLEIGTTNHIVLEFYEYTTVGSPYWMGTVPRITVNGITYTGCAICRRNTNNYYLEQI